VFALRSVLAALTALGLIGHAAASASDVRFGGEIMGTHWSVRISDAVTVGREAEAAGAVEQALAGVDRSMSTYRAESPLSVFNRAAVEQSVVVPRELIEVVLLSMRISAETAGAFDPTIGAAVDAWGFGPAGRPERLPSDPEVERLRDQVGWEGLVVDPDAGTLRKLRDGLRVDLSGIAKGYAVDRAAEALQGLGIANFVIELGGEVRAQGVSPRGTPWRIGIEAPADRSDAPRAVQWTTEVADAALSTSGDYRNYYERDGVRVSHTIDPRTLRPIAHGLASVTVVLPSCAVADAYATGLNVLGPEAGFELAESAGIAALFVQREGGGFAVRTTSTWPAD
jgi:thiamine biosynthesis lipoprotein